MTTTDTPRYFLSYGSAKLPLKLVNEITEADLHYSSSQNFAHSKMRLLCAKFWDD